MRIVTNLIILTIVLACRTLPATAEVTIQAEKAAIRTEGGPLPGGCWNLWSNGRVGQSLRFTTAGNYGIVVRAWGSPAAGVWPEMALLVDGRAVKTVTVGSAQRANYRFDVELAAGIHEIAAAYLNDAVIGKEDRNLYLERFTIIPPPAAVEPVLAAKQELAEAAEKREQQIVAATQAAIEKHRKADAKIRIVDARRPASARRQGRRRADRPRIPLRLQHLHVRSLQERGPERRLQERFEELFNYATVGFYWRWYESQRGKPNYEYTDKVVAWCREHGIRMKGHPLLWGNEAGVPPWSHGQPPPEIQRQRVQDIIGRYQGKIEFWEVVNEPSHLAEPKIDQPYRWARQADPQGLPDRQRL